MTREEVLAAVGVQIVQDDAGMIEFLVQTDAGEVSVFALMVRGDDTLILERVDVEGEGLTIPIVRRVAKAFGQAENVSQVIVQGGKRTSGAGRGSIPTPIKVKVQA